MIVLDTHIWVWWVDGSTRLTPDQVQHLRTYEAAGLGVSVISCWEVANVTPPIRSSSRPPDTMTAQCLPRTPGFLVIRTSRH